MTISFEKFGGNNMKVLGSFVDCVYESHLYKEDIGDIRTKLISRLPDKRICEMASVLIIDTKYDMYVVKIRRPELNSSGCVDIEKTHKKIYETDFIEISNRDYEGLDQPIIETASITTSYSCVFQTWRISHCIEQKHAYG